MRPIAAALLLACATATAAPLPATAIRYEIAVRCDPPARTLAGVETIHWTNPGEAAVDRVPVHLYLNAFAHEHTTFFASEGLHDSDIDEFIHVFPDPFGWTDLTRVEMDTPGGPVAVPFAAIQPDDGNPLDRSLVELRLPAPLAPGATLTLHIAFAARLPNLLFRTGAHGDFAFVAQWFPKIGAYEPKGVRGSSFGHFAARQFRAATEFYADFADYDVSITVPAGYGVAATGHATPAAETGDGQPFHFVQRGVHDFAFVTGKNLRVETFRHLPRSLPSGEPPVPVDIHYVVAAGSESQVPRWRAAAERTLDELGGRIGVYPYSDFTVVMPPWAGLRASGMEYPTLVTGMPGGPLWDHFPLRELNFGEDVITHEITHNYFYGLVASNEQEEAFLDEGFTQYWGLECLKGLKGEERSMGRIFGRDINAYDLQSFGVARRADAIREPIRKKPAGMFYPGSEGNQVYVRPMLTLRTAAALFGQAEVDRLFAAYFARWRFRHPSLADFLAVADEQCGADGAATEECGHGLAEFLREAFSRDRVPDFSVGSFTVEKWEAPRGHLFGDGGAGAKSTTSDKEAGLPARAREADGQVLMEITDAGFAHDDYEQPGRTWGHLSPRPGGLVADADWRDDGSFHESRVRLDGPGWAHLPAIDVEFRFADGVLLRDLWDGRSAWRSYHFTRRAPLVEVAIDPRHLFALDVKPENNARRRKPDRSLSSGWAASLAGVAGWVGQAVALWL